MTKITKELLMNQKTEALKNGNFKEVAKITKIAQFNGITLDKK